MTDVNHCIAKEIVDTPYAVFALEGLKSIRVQKSRGKKFNQKLNSWAFFQFEQFLCYKAEAFGKQVISVDSRYTSQKCSVCGYVHKGNRKGSTFKCRSCGYQNHADMNAAFNIAQAGKSGLEQADVDRPIVASSETEHPISPQLQALSVRKSS